MHHHKLSEEAAMQCLKVKASEPTSFFLNIEGFAFQINKIKSTLSIAKVQSPAASFSQF